MYRFFIKEEQIHDGMIEICGSDVNHIKNVLRMKTGDKVYLSNGSDLEYECSLLEWTDDTILAKIEDVHGMETELPVKITLYQGLPKGDKMEMIVQKAVELGVAEIVPVAMKRCVVKLDAKKAAKKVSRWNTIALSAAKQAKRGIIPEVREVRNFKDILEEVQDTEFMLVPYEEAKGMQASKELISQAKELGSLNDQLESSNDSETDSSVDSSQDVQEEGTISPSHSSESSTDESLNSLLSQIKPLLPQNNGTWSVYVCNLMKNTEGVIDDQPMQAASLIKLFIMGTVYENYESLSETYGADTLNSYLNSMITVSDNDAANKLVNMLGDGDDEAGMRAVNAFCASHGYSSTSMGRLLLQSNEYGDNYTSVSDCGHFLKEIYQSNAGTAESTLAHTDAMYSLLKMQQRRNKIPANLPDGVKVANKTGELDDVENDAGIIYNTAKNIDLVVCFMSQDLTDSSEAQAVIAQDSRLIYGYYNE